MELLLQNNKVQGGAPWGHICKKRAPSRAAATHSRCTAALQIRAATHNMMAFRIEQPDRGTFLQVPPPRLPLPLPPPPLPPRPSCTSHLTRPLYAPSYHIPHPSHHLTGL